MTGQLIAAFLGGMLGGVGVSVVASWQRARRGTVLGYDPTITVPSSAPGQVLTDEAGEPWTVMSRTYSHSRENRTATLTVTLVRGREFRPGVP